MSVFGNPAYSKASGNAGEDWPSASSREEPRLSSMKVCTRPAKGTRGDAIVFAMGVAQQLAYHRSSPVGDNRRQRRCSIPSLIEIREGVV